MRKKGKNNVNTAEQNCSALDGTMISPLVSKVNPSHLADFAAFRAALWWKVLNTLYKSLGKKDYPELRVFQYVIPMRPKK
jgi:hypothetical protein